MGKIFTEKRKPVKNAPSRSDRKLATFLLCSTPLLSSAPTSLCQVLGLQRFRNLENCFVGVNNGVSKYTDVIGIPKYHSENEPTQSERQLHSWVFGDPAQTCSPRSNVIGH